MVHAGVQLFFVLLSFIVDDWSLPESKTGAEPPARGRAGCGDPFGWAVHILAKTFSPVGVSTDVAVFRRREGGTQCTGDFWRGKKPKQTMLCVFTSLYGLSTLALLCHIFYMYNSFEKSTDWQLESNLLLLIWITALGCILLQLWPGGSGTLPLATAAAAWPILGLPLEALNGASGTLMCEHEQREHWLEQLPLLLARCRCR